MASAEIQQIQNIMLGGRGATTPGQLRVHPGGFVWRKDGGGKVVELPKADISSLSWIRLPRGFQLTVRQRTGSKVKFQGFKEQDVNSLTPFLSSTMGLPPKQKELAISGHNWGNAVIDGNMLSFMVGDKQAFEISISDVSQTQLQGKNDVMLQFHVDDTTGAAEKDTLVEMTFHIPTSNTTYVGTQDKSSSQVFQDQILARADVGPTGDESVVEFDNVQVVIPRGRFRVELHLTHIRLQGMAVDFKIQYKSIQRIFVLPKAHQPHTFVAIALDTPLRKGQTMYPHVVLQFDNEEIFEGALEISDELLNTTYKGRLEAEYKEKLIHEAFARILSGLSGSKILGVKPPHLGGFKSDKGGFSLRTSLKAEEGSLYPLEKAFFFLPKPPTLIPHDEIEEVNFERWTGSSSSSNLQSSSFDFKISLQSGSNLLFRNIQRSEYRNLFSYCTDKGLKVMHDGEEASPSMTAAAVAELHEDDRAAYRNRMGAEGGAGAEGESDEEDEDFVGEEEEDEEDEEEEQEEGEDRSSKKKGRRDEDEEENEEDDEAEDEKPKPKAASKTPVQAKRKKEGGEGEEGGKKKRKKKDPDAPKRSLSGFMYFSADQREIVKRDNPGIAFADVGKVIGEKWKALSAAEKAPYEEKAKADKVRYSDEMRNYKGPAGKKDEEYDEE